MIKININNPIEVYATDIKALEEALEYVGTVRFIHQYDMGYGDYTKEKQNEPPLSLDEFESLIQKYKTGSTDD